MFQRMGNIRRHRLDRKHRRYLLRGLIFLCKCLNPKKYGVQPVDAIASKIFSESRRSEFRVLNNKMTVRCDDTLYTRLQQAKKTFGADCTTQEFVMTAILHECERIECKRKEGPYYDSLRYGC